MDMLKGLMDLARRFSAGRPFLVLVLSLLWLDTVLAWNGKGLWLHLQAPIQDVLDTLLEVPVRQFVLFALATLAAWIVVLSFLAWGWTWLIIEVNDRIRDWLEIEDKSAGREWMFTQVVMDLAARSNNEVLYQRCLARERAADDLRQLHKVLLGIWSLLLFQWALVSPSAEPSVALLTEGMAQWSVWIRMAAGPVFLVMAASSVHTLS